MKRIYKVLALLFCVTLLCGAIFALASSAADEADEVAAFLESIEATRAHYNYDGTAEYDFLQYDTYVATNTQQAASPTIQVGTAATGAATTGKFGRVRSVTRNGNTFYEWISPVDAIAVSSANNKYSDMVLTLFDTVKTATTVRNADYIVHEFDMATRTDFPGGIAVIWEGRSGDGAAAYRARRTPAIYNAATNTWEGGGSTIKVEPNQWSHITLVVQVVEDITVTTTYTKTETTETTDAEGVVTAVTKVYTTTAVSLNGADPTLTSKVVTTTKVGDAEATTDAGVACESIIGQEGVTSSAVTTYNYSKSQGKMFWNGEYFNSFVPFSTTNNTIRQVWVNFSGIGYAYGSQHTGREAGDSVAYDNNTYTIINKGTAALDALFAKNAPTNLSGLTHEDVYSSTYDFPSDVLGAATLTDAEGNVTDHAELKDAVAYAKANELVGATVTLYGREYLEVAIDYPITIDANGYGLLNGCEISDGLVALNYYEHNYADIGSVSPFKTRIVSLDDDVNTSILLDRIPKISVEGNTGSVLQGIQMYAADGTKVAFTTVTEEHVGKTYSICPVLKVDTKENNIVFYTISADDAITFYDTTDLWAAGVKPAPVKSEVTTTEADGVVTKTWTVTQEPKCIPDGMLIVLVKDATAADLMAANGGTFTIDLAGHKLNAPTQLISTYAIRVDTTYTQVGDAEATSTKANNVKNWYKNSKVFIYSSAAGAEIIAGGNLIYGKNSESSSQANNVALYFGYQNAETMSEHRITVNFGSQIIGQEKGAIKYLYLANLDLYNGKAHASGLLSVQQSRGQNVYFTDCNLYTQSPLFGSNANSGVKNVYFVNTNVYAEGGIAMNWLETSPTGAGDYVNGDTKLTMTNSKIYGMTFGQTAGDGLSEYTAKFIITMDASSFISDAHANIRLPEGKALVKNPLSVTIGDTTYTTIYAVGTGTEPTAKFDVYDVPFAQFTGEQTPVYSWDIVENGWFAHYATPAGETTYDYANDPYNTITPRGYEVYDEEGNLVTGPAVAGKTYRVFVKLEKVAVSFVIIDKDGNVTPYFEPTLFGVTFATGDTLVLMSHDVSAVSSISAEMKIDLNGRTLYTEKIVQLFNPAESSAIYVYSSLPGARICVTPTVDTTGSGYLANVEQNNAKFYLGYSDAQTKCENRIEVFSGALIQLGGSNSQAYINNCVLVRNGIDNYGYCNFRGGSDDDRKFVFDNCDIYNNSTLICQRGSSAANTCSGDAYFTNCRIFTTADAAIYEFYAEPSKGYYSVGIRPKVVFDNTQLYGGRRTQNVSPTYQDCYVTVIFQNNSTTSVLDTHTVAGEGYVLVPVTTNNSITIPGISCPAYGRYGAEEAVAFAGTYTYAYKAVKESQYLSTIYQNVSLDSNINANTYIPVWDYITSAKLVESDVELLDRENVVSIAGGQYYLITLSEAPKDAWDTQTLALTFKNGNTVTFEVSIGRYAKRLLALQREDAYTVDSQEMMRYVLKYIKEVAVAFGGADAETIFAGIEGIDVNTDLGFKEATDLSTEGIRDYITGGTLNLESYPGFAFTVAEGFVGTVRAELGHYASDEKTFTADAPATGEEYLLLQNIPAYALRGTITITVTTAEGAVKSAEFNLATYANYFVEKTYAKAVYAYSVKAEEYLEKHPEVGTLNK